MCKKRLNISEFFQYSKPLDWFILIVSLSIASFSAFSLTNAGVPAVAIIENSVESWAYTLQEDQVLHIEGPLGITTIKIENQSVTFLDSPCPHKTCIADGTITSSNQWLACLPNSIFAYIEAKEQENEFDAIAN